MGEFVVADRRHLYMQIYSIQEWTRYFVQISFDTAWWTGAILFRVIKVAAGAGVHGGDEHEFGWIVYGESGSGYGHFPSLHGLAKDFKNTALEFGQFIQK